MEKIIYGENLLIQDELLDNDIIKVNPAKDIDTLIRVSVYQKKVDEFGKPIKVEAQIFREGKYPDVTLVKVYSVPERNPKLEVYNDFDIISNSKQITEKIIKCVQDLKSQPKFKIRGGFGEVEINGENFYFGPTSMKEDTIQIYPNKNKISIDINYNVKRMKVWIEESKNIPTNCYMRFGLDSVLSHFSPFAEEDFIEEDFINNENFLHLFHKK